jgi:hypothetical protein
MSDRIRMSESVSVEADFSEEKKIDPPIIKAKPRRPTKGEDLLFEDPLVNKDFPELATQFWHVISFISPEGNSSNGTRIYKLRGSFTVKERADAYAEYCRRTHDNEKFNVFVGETGKWLYFDPDPKDIRDQRHTNEGMNEFMSNYLAGVDKVNKVHEERMEQVHQRNARSGTQQSERLDAVKERMQAELKQRKHKQEQMSSTIETLDALTKPVAEADAPAPRRKKGKAITEEKLRLLEQELADKKRQTDEARASLQAKAKVGDLVSSEVKSLKALVEKKLARA